MDTRLISITFLFTIKRVRKCTVKRLSHKYTTKIQYTWNRYHQICTRFLWKRYITIIKDIKAFLNKKAISCSWIGVFIII